MARKGRMDQGLLAKRNAAGKTVWWVRLYHQGKEERFGSYPTKTEARDFYRKAKDEQRQGRFFPEMYQRSAAKLISTLLEDYLATTAGKRTATQERQKANWWSEYFKNRRLPALTPAAIESARVELRKGVRYLKDKAGVMQPVSGPPRGNATINRFTDWLRHVCNWAVKIKELRENPVKAIDRHPEDEAPTFQYSPDQEAALITQLTDEEVDMLRLAALTGMRRGNQFLLRKDQINLGLGAIMLPRTKTRKSRIVHLSEEGKEILRRQWARYIDSPWLYPGRKKERPRDADTWYRKRFKPALLAAGIQTEETDKLWHAWRHTFGGRLASLGYREAAIMQAGGWTSSKAAQRYIALYDEALKEAAERLSTIKPTGTQFGTVTNNRNSDTNRGQDLPQAVEKS